MEMNPEETPKDSPETPELKQIRTFQGDVAEAIKHQGESLYSIQHAEVKKHEKVDAEEEKRAPKVKNPETEKRKKAVLLSLGTLVLVALGGATAYMGYSEFATKSAPSVVTSLPNRFVRATLEAEVVATGLTRETLVQKLFELEQAEIKDGGIAHIIFEDELATSTLLSTEKFLKILESQAPPSLVRAFNPLFMFGLMENENVPSTFILVNLDSFENAFAGMLAWEKDMAKDLGDILTTRERVRNLTQDASFEDITIRNKDARIIRDTEDKTVLLYSFFENKLLIITDNEETFRTLVTRLTNEKLVR
jgi:hypothetical protein